MKILDWKWSALLGFALAVAVLVSCDDEDEGPMQKGDVEFEITDAPSDDASVEGVFVTIADVKVDGQSLSGFSKTTIDLKSYQEGKTKVLGSAELDARSYNSITLVLDLDEDDDGNSPGCYVLDENDEKHKLKSTNTGTTDVVITEDWDVAANTKTNVVMDFDIRKAIEYSDGAEAYAFVGDNDLTAAVRVVTKGNAGTIEGTYQEDIASNSDKIIVYAYKRGSFNMSAETEGDMKFPNAVTSAEVKQGLSGKTYKLALLEEGEYELKFASLEDNGSGKLMFESLLESETTLDGSEKEFFEVDAGFTINLVTSITGILN